MKQPLATYFLVIAFLILTSENGLPWVEGINTGICERLVLGIYCPPEEDSRICLTECSKISRGHHPIDHSCLSGHDSTFCFCQWLSNLC
ncbi:hypothetical protein RND71_028152 [Anisodus tanguticus]|uniref:Uncharacterized protein n=1 Tax=Anisodus tanguticus TaxID=243964 RepID=A0AAE1RHY8_9SOLA|nr:hypothetical protein RND71_028152 [Anisodus tanguticus]